MNNMILHTSLHGLWQNIDTNFDSQKNIPYLTLTGVPWDVFQEDFSENICYNSTVLYFINNTANSCNVTGETHMWHLTHWGRDKMAALSQTTLSNAFSWMKMFEFRLKLHWSLSLRVQLTIFQHWLRYWLGADQATSHYLSQWWLDYAYMHHSASMSQSINQLWTDKFADRQT